MEQWLNMEQWLEEQGYVICPLAPETYIICYDKCEECEYYIEYERALKERGE